MACLQMLGLACGGDYENADSRVVYHNNMVDEALMSAKLTVARSSAGPALPVSVVDCVASTLREMDLSLSPSNLSTLRLSVLSTSALPSLLSHVTGAVEARGALTLGQRLTLQRRVTRLFTVPAVAEQPPPPLLLGGFGSELGSLEALPDFGLGGGGAAGWAGDAVPPAAPAAPRVGQMKACTVRGCKYVAAGVNARQILRGHMESQHPTLAQVAAKTCTACDHAPFSRTHVLLEHIRRSAATEEQREGEVKPHVLALAQREERKVAEARKVREARETEAAAKAGRKAAKATKKKGGQGKKGTAAAEMGDSE